MRLFSSKNAGLWSSSPLAPTSYMAKKAITTPEPARRPAAALLTVLPALEGRVDCVGAPPKLKLPAPPPPVVGPSVPCAEWVPVLMPVGKKPEVVSPVPKPEVVSASTTVFVWMLKLGDAVGPEAAPVSVVSVAGEPGEEPGSPIVGVQKPGLASSLVSPWSAQQAVTSLYTHVTLPTGQSPAHSGTPDSYVHTSPMEQHPLPSAQALCPASSHASACRRRRSGAAVMKPMRKRAISAAAGGGGGGGAGGGPGGGGARER